MNKTWYLSFLTGIKHGIIFLLLASISATSATINTFRSEVIQNNGVTIRVNTFRRLDLLGIFLEHYHKCQNVRQIQIIWSDQESTPPLEWLDKYPKDKVAFEIHRNNSLNNRFRNLLPITTEAVLSIDDDLVTPCATLDSAVQVWMSNKNVLVGFSPRMTTYDIITGNHKPKEVSTLAEHLVVGHILYHSDEGLFAAQKLLGHFIDEKKNCEDIAMAHTIARELLYGSVGQYLRRAPQGSAANLPILSTGCIQFSFSSDTIHRSCIPFVRGHCLSYLEQLTGFDTWALAYQKVVPLDVTSIYRWWSDTK